MDVISLLVCWNTPSSPVEAGRGINSSHKGSFPDPLPNPFPDLLTQQENSQESGVGEWLTPLLLLHKAPMRCQQETFSCMETDLCFNIFSLRFYLILSIFLPFLIPLVWKSWEKHLQFWSTYYKRPTRKQRCCYDWYSTRSILWNKKREGKKKISFCASSSGSQLLKRSLALKVLFRLPFS